MKTNIDTIRDIQDVIDRAKSLGMLGWGKAQIALTCGINKGDKACADHDQSCMGGCPFWKDQAPTIDPDAMLFEEIKSLLIDDSVCKLLRYGYKSPSNFVDDDDCTSLHRLYDISNELFQRKEAEK